MKINPYISIREHKFLNTFASLIFALILVNLSYIMVENYNKNIESRENIARYKADNAGKGKLDFTGYALTRTDYILPFRLFALLIILPFRLFALLILPSLFFARKFVFSVFLSGLSIFSLTYEAYLVLMAASYSTTITLQEIINLIARPLDYVVFFLVFILLFWQIFILLRILVKSIQRNAIMP